MSSIVYITADRIKERRKLLNMTQEDLAKAIGIKSRSVIMHIEKYDQSCPARYLKKLAEVLRCDVAYLVGTQDDPIKAETDIKAVTGLSFQAIETLMELQNCHDTDALNLISMFITEYKEGSPSLATYINQYKHSSRIIDEFNQLPEDQKVEVRPEGHSITWNEDKQAASLYHASRLFTDMIEKTYGLKSLNRPK